MLQIFHIEDAKTRTAIFLENHQKHSISISLMKKIK